MTFLEIIMLRIAWFSDFSSNKELSSKSAYFSDLVLPLLREGNDIDCYGAEAFTADGQSVFSWTEAMGRHRRQQYDVFIYQIENVDKLGFVFKFLKQMPGVVIIHDLNCLRFYGRDNVLENPQKNSLVPKISSDLDHFNLMNPLLNNFCLDPYLYSLIRIFTNPRTSLDYKNLCAKCGESIYSAGEPTEDSHTYVLSCLQAFADSGGEDVRSLAGDFCTILENNLSYLKGSLARWEKYMYYRGSA